MLLKEISWIRAKSGKMCPMLKKAALNRYRPLRGVPCFIQQPLKFIKQRLFAIPVVVQLHDHIPGALHMNDLAAFVGCRVNKELSVINAFSTRVNMKKLESLVGNRSVKKVWYDREVRAVLDVASPTVQAPSMWERMLTGKGITVAVLDTGVYNHPDLAGRIKGFKDCINRKDGPYDDNGHGTHVAGDIASNGSKSGLLYRAPAPEAEIVGVKVLDKNGSGTISTVIEGLQWCIDKREELSIKVANLSLGAQASESYRDDPVCQAVEKVWRAGIVVCVAAGNDGPELNSISSPGIDPLVITVGALNDAGTIEPGDDAVADFSSRGPTVDNLVKPDVLAPGTNIISLRAPGSMTDKKSKKTRVGQWYASFSGTSMATPVCAGVVAQMLQLNNSMPPEQVKARLMETARKLSGLDPNVQGAGVIDIKKAAQYSGAAGGPAPNV